MGGHQVRRAVLITATEPEPRRYGKQVVLGGILDHLVSRLGPENVHLVLLGDPALDRPAVPYRQHVVGKPGTVGQALSVLKGVVLPPRGAGYRRPLQEAALNSAAVGEAVRGALRSIDADLEIWDTVRTGQYAPSTPRRTSPPVRRLLYADDLFSERYAAMLADTDSGNPGGEFQKLLPGPARKVLADPRVYRPLLRLERDLVAASEERQPAWFDATYLISDEETGRLRRRVQNQHPRPVVDTLPPMLKDRGRLRRAPQFDPPEFSFIGGFDYAPNLDGLDWFLTHARAAVDAAVPGAVINVIGAGTDAGLPSGAAWGGRVRFLGWVDDLDAVLGRSAGLLSPLRSGSGVKIKVLEALARGLPVVATPSGVQGIAASEETGCLLGTTPAELAAGMARLADPATNDQLSKAARQAWDERYAPPVVQRRYDEIFGTS
ncbi:glycosyltransferase family 4 protein [Spongisporangium articulatum]|uniref:Glycosyltransferase family 4 protein n=1 Tax=Spongisporangium articulatum TaxID=3362603 RepID=A0ABW8ALF1_9ACTN